MFFYLCLKFSVLSFLLFNLFKLFFCKGRAPSSPVDKNDVIGLFMLYGDIFQDFFRLSGVLIRNFEPDIALIRLNNID